VIYDLLFKVSAQTMLKVAANPKYLGARIGLTNVLHTWGSAMTHHPHTPDAYDSGHHRPPSQQSIRSRSASAATPDAYA